MILNYDACSIIMPDKTGHKKLLYFIYRRGVCGACNSHKLLIIQPQENNNGQIMVPY